jgi:outer membrane protein
MVSKQKRTILTFAVIGLLALCSGSSFAQKLGVVDGNKILESYSEYQAANAKIQAVVKSWQDTLQQMTKTAQEKYESYQKIKETMSKDALTKAQEEIDGMQKNIQNYNNMKMNQQTGEYLKVQKDVMTPVLEKVKAAIGTIAKKKKIEVVFDKNAQTTYVDSEKVTDISDEVIAALKK